MATIVDLQNDAEFASIPGPEQFRQWVEASLQQSHDELEQTICIVDESASRELNRRYRGKDSATNVLAFPADNDLLEYDCLGDLVICAPVVQQEASQQGKQELGHWAHLVIHGMLHLQGYDHQSETQAGDMERVEIEILDTLGYANPYNV